MIVRRIKQYIDAKGINIASFERSIGMSNASFGKSYKKGGAIGSDKIENILSVYPDINPAWLLTGRGEMLCAVEGRESEEKREVEAEKKTQPTPASIQISTAEVLNIIRQQAEEIGMLKEKVLHLEEAIRSYTNGSVEPFAADAG